MGNGPDIGDPRYQILEQVGEGAVATVWRARDLQSEQTVAIKLLRAEELDDETVERLAQELEILAELDHPCIVKVVASGVARRENPYIVIEWVEGLSLRERLGPADELSPEDKVDIINQICSALTETHARGIVHRDLKPENVLLVAPDLLAVKLVDFGMAKVLRSNAPLRTSGMKVFGTPHYMAPERARARPVSAATDVYAIGVIAYEMLCGQRPFDGSTPMEILLEHCSGSVPLMPQLPRDAADALRAALAKDPAERPDAATFAHRLASALSG